MKAPLADQTARDAIRTALDETLVVEAAAGTGKTTELVARILALLERGVARLSGIVAVTFTEKAAGEMKLRLRTEIERARLVATDDVRKRLDQALAELEAAHIGTIHAFCAEILRERPVEAKIDPIFQTADETVQERLFDETFEAWFQAALEDPGEGTRRVLRKRFRDRDSGGPRLLLRRAARTLVEQRDFDAPWRRDPFDREVAIDDLLKRLDALVPMYELANDKTWWLAKSLEELWRFRKDVRRREDLGNERDYDGLEEELRALARQGRHWNWKGGWNTWGGGYAKETVLRERDAFKEALERFLDRADADLAACLHRDLRPVTQAYVEMQRKAGRLDFLDLLLVTRDLLAKDHAVRGELQRRFTHLLVDEFQDTDPLQAEILLLLAADDPNENDYRRARPIAGKLFVVGDPKQSIYRFRRADVVLYDTIKRRLLGSGARLLHLSTSFRSAPGIQRTINGAFDLAMKRSEDGSQPDYVALQPFRPEPDGRPSVIALPVPSPYSEKSNKVTQWAVSESTPEAVGAFVHWLVHESGWKVTERDRDGAVPIEERHVCLLFKRFVSFREDVTRPYVRALETRRIAHVLVGGRSFHQREEVMAMKSALSAIEWPDDELSVYATLRGPFFALTDDVLLAWRHEQGTVHPFRTPGPQIEALAPVRDALVLLAELHRRRNRRPIADTMVQLLEATRAHAGIAIWPTGAQALANLLRLLEGARKFEAGGATSFRAYLAHLDDEEERGGGADAPVVEEGEGGVRIMTVHKAKGLEFPVVILVDPAAPAAQREPSRWVDADRRLWVTPLAGCVPAELLEHRADIRRHDEEEALRLLYVAATRARELLVVPCVGDGKIDGWVGPLHPALYPSSEDWRSDRPAPGCPRFGPDSVRERQGADVDPSMSVRPGLHVSNVGTDVVWWDPYLFPNAAEIDTGLRQQTILAVDAGATRRDRASEAAHEAWRARRVDDVASGSVPRHRVAIVTKDDPTLAHGAAAIEVAIEDTGVARAGRPHGKNFGVLVHAILATIDLTTRDEARIAAAAALEGRRLGQGESEIAWATKAVAGALAHPLVVRAAKAGTRRECPVSYRAPDGELVEGIVDLAFEEDGTWILVDFKTDVALAAKDTSAYVAQLRRYAQGIHAATNAAVKAFLLGV
jgi:ATP-dependent exoDNAse (exonuclease V) beta subunit